MSTSIILASASPRRRELLERVGISVTVSPADVDESVLPGEEAIPYAMRVGLAKATHIAAQHPGIWVLAADTVVEIGGTPMGKAADREEARSMLLALRGRTHRVTTSLALCREGAGPQRLQEAVTTEVVMRNFSEEELEDYLDASEWQGKAGAYAVQGMAAAFVSQVRGSITNVIGLPLAEVVELFAEQGIATPSYQSGTPS